MVVKKPKLGKVDRNPKLGNVVGTPTVELCHRRCHRQELSLLRAKLHFLSGNPPILALLSLHPIFVQPPSVHYWPAHLSYSTVP